MKVILLYQQHVWQPGFCRCVLQPRGTVKRILWLKSERGWRCVTFRRSRLSCPHHV